MAKSEAIQKEIQADKKKYALVRTPTPENEALVSDEAEKIEKSDKKKKRKRDA